MLNLNTCVEGQELRLRNEELVKYVGRHHCSDATYNHEAIAENGKPYTYTDGGCYFRNYQDMRDVIEILPLETTDSPKLDKHPSVAWWESCPWITDRKPTEEDGDKFGRVHVKASGTSMILASNWDGIGDGESWIHIWHWKPPTLTDQEQALQLINNHEDGWRPTPDQWHIIRKGLEAS